MAFLVRFSPVSANSSKFKSDKNGNKPYIGELLAGTATGTIYNGSMFKREGLNTFNAYLCDNTSSIIDGEEYINTRVIMQVSPLEVVPMIDQLGAPHLDRPNASETPEDDESPI